MPSNLPEYKLNAGGENKCNGTAASKHQDEREQWQQAN